MKTILLIVSALTFFFLDPTFEVPYSRLESGFNSNNASSIIALGKEKVLIKIDKDFYRPNDVNFLLGSSAKAFRILKWKPKTSLKMLIKMMIKNDLNLIKNNKFY